MCLPKKMKTTQRAQEAVTLPKANLPQRLTALLVYGRPPLVFGGLVCAIAVMWNRSYRLYMIGILLLLVSMSFDMVGGWFAARYPPHPTLANLARRSSRWSRSA